MVICSEWMFTVYCTILAYVFSIKREPSLFLIIAQMIFVIISDINASLLPFVKVSLSSFDYFKMIYMICGTFLCS